MKSKVTIKNQRIVLLIVLFSFGLIIYKLAAIILLPEIDGKNIKAFANSRNTTTKTLHAGRGNIYDSDGDILAQSVKSYTLIAYLEESRTKDDKKVNHVINKEKTARELARILNMDEFEILNKLKKDKYQVEIKKNISEVLKQKIDALELDGLGYIESLKRYYKSGTFASYLIGYAKTYDDGKISGELGIEGFYNQELSGVNGSTTYQRDAQGYKFINTPVYTKPAQPGADLYLTVDSNIQLILENAISKIDKSAPMSWATITVLDAKTGAIKGSATNPTFDPNNLNTIESFLNPLISYPFEPGSTLKTFSFAAAIDSGNYIGDETFMSGSIKVDDYTISDFNKIGWGKISYDRGFAMSANTAATRLALKMGNKTLREYYDKLGFGRKTGLELKGEQPGVINFRYKSELATASFGQGVMMTPIQMIQAFTTMTNNGDMLKPYIVEKMVGSDGEVLYEGKRTVVEQVYDKSTVDYMHDLLYEAVYNGNSSMWRPKNLEIIGKTGTSQIASPTGGYLTGSTNYVLSFAALFPKEDPKYILYMAAKQFQGPRTILSDATTTAIDEIASYSKLVKEDTNKLINKKITLPNYVGTKTKKIDLKNSKLLIIGDGDYVIDQYPKKNTNLFEDDLIILKTNSDEYKMIDLTNFTLNEAKTISKFLGLKLNYKGYGVVASQSIETNTPIKPGDIINLEFSK